MATSRFRRAGKKNRINPETQNQEKDHQVAKIIILLFIMLAKICYNLPPILSMIKYPKEFFDNLLLKFHLHPHQLNL
jgi:hypothetical protein